MTWTEMQVAKEEQLLERIKKAADFSQLEAAFKDYRDYRYARQYAENAMNGAYLQLVDKGCIETPSEPPKGIPTHL